MGKEIKEKIKRARRGLKNSFIVGLIGALFLILILFIGVIGWGIYKLDWRNDFIARVVAILPFPAAQVGNNFILDNDYIKTLNSAITFYKKQGGLDPNNEANLKDIKKMVLEERLIKNLLILKIAQQYGVNVSRDEIDAKINEIMKNKGSQAELEKFLADYYSFSLKDYEKYFVEPNLYYDKTSLAIASDDKLNGQAKNKVIEFLTKLKNGGKFEDLAKIYSEDDQAQNGGWVGEIRRGQLPKVIEDQLFNLEVGQNTGILNLNNRFQIFKLEKKDLDKGLLTIRTITVKMTSLDDLLIAKKAAEKIKIFVY